MFFRIRIFLRNHGTSTPSMFFLLRPCFSGFEFSYVITELLLRHVFFSFFLRNHGTSTPSMFFLHVFPPCFSFMFFHVFLFVHVFPPSMFFLRPRFFPCFFHVFHVFFYGITFITISLIFGRTDFGKSFIFAFGTRWA